MKQSLTRNEIDNILKKGKRIVSDTLKIIYKKSESGDNNYAILVPKKTIREATKRNKIRRVIREVIREIDIPQSKMIVIYTGKDYSYPLIRKNIEQMVGKIA